MKFVIETLTKKIKSLEVEKRVFSKGLNKCDASVKQIEQEIKEHKIALNILCSEKTEA